MGTRKKVVQQVSKSELILSYLPVLLISIALAALMTLSLEWLRFAPPSGMEDGRWTGFAAYDVPTYYANAQELFTGGAGVVYANPYDLSENPPHIYFHLSTIAVGHLWYWFGLDASIQEPLWRMVLGTTMFFLLNIMVGTLLKLPVRSMYRYLTHLFLCIGGGITSIYTLFPAAVYTLTSPDASGFSETWLAMFRHQESSLHYGVWLMSMARTFLMTSELFYHVLILGTMLAFWQKRWPLAISLFAVTWLSHPFTALQLGAILHAWLLLEIWLRKDFRKTGSICLASIFTIQLLGLAYYKLFLGSYEVHREVEQNFALPISLEISTTAPWNLLFAYGFLVPIALAFLLSPSGRRQFLDNEMLRFLVCGGVITFLLIQHDKLPFLTNPVQPLHFSRGYLWLFLALVCFQAERTWFPTGLPLKKVILFPIISGLLLLQTLDTLFFYVVYTKSGWKDWHATPYLSPEMADIIDQATELPRGVAMTMEASPTNGLSYLLPTFTHHTSILAHGCNTPYLFDRSNRVRALIEDGGIAPLEGVDYLFIDGAYIPLADARDAYADTLSYFELIAENPRWSLWQRITDD